MKKEIETAKEKGFDQTDIDDVITVNNVKSGNNKDFKKIIEKYNDVVLRKMLVYCKGDLMKAEDMTSDIMIKVLENLSKWKIQDGKFKNWIYTLASNYFFDSCRKEKVNVKRFGHSVSIDSLFRNDVGESQTKSSKVQIADEDSRVDEKIEEGENIEKMMLALKQLSKTEKEIVELRYFSGLSFEEISETLGINISTCRVTIQRTIIKLRNLIK